ncbi:MAG: type IV pilus assembly protein PilM [Pseudomonadota bacterium]
MVFGKNDHLVGLDIGSSFVKVAEIRESSKGISLKKLAVAYLPPGAIEEGSIREMETVANVIRKLFKSQKIKEKKVAISTGGYSVVVKTINMPTATEIDLQDSIRFEAEQYIPYDIEDVNIDFQIIGTSEFSPDQMNVLLVAAKKDLVAEYMDLITLAGLNPCIIDVDTFALQNAYETFCPDNSKGVFMLMDVGASKTSLNILRKTTSLMMRDSSFGTAQIRDEIMTVAGVTAQEADQYLNGMVPELISREVYLGICDRVSRGWCAEVYNVIRAYQSKSSEGGVERIILSGGGAFVPGFAQNLAVEVSTEVAIINPFEKIRIDPGLFSEGYLNQMAPLSTIALGLALRKVNDK